MTTKTGSMTRRGDVVDCCCESSSSSSSSTSSSKMIKKKEKQSKPSIWCYLCCCCCCCCRRRGGRGRRSSGKSKCLISISSTCYALLIVLLHVYLIKNRVERVMPLAVSTLASYTSSSSWSTPPVVAYSSLVVANSNNNQSDSTGAASTSIKTRNHLDIDLFDALRAEIDASTAGSPIPHRHVELVTRLVTLVLSALFLTLFLICSLQKCANYANDSVKFGRDFFAEQLHHHRNHISRETYEKAKSPGTVSNGDSGRGTTTAAMIDSSTSSMSLASSSSSSPSSSGASPPVRVGSRRRSRRNCCCCCFCWCCLQPIARLVELVWRHFLPFAPLAHLISILLLVVPELVFVPIDGLRADIESASASMTACQQLRPNVSFPMYSASSSSSSSSCLTDRFNALFTKLVPNDLGSVSSSSSSSSSTAIAFDKEYFVRQLDVYFVELISLCLAFATLSIRYGSVFWYTNKTLSYIITLIGLVSSVQQLFQLYSFLYINRQSLINRLAKTMIKFIIDKAKSQITIESRSIITGSGRSSSFDSSSFDFTPPAVFDLYLINTRLKLILLYAVLSVLVLLTLVPAYVFVYLKYKERFMIEEAHFLAAVFGTKTSSSSDRRDQGLLVTSTGARIRQHLSDDELRLDKMSLLVESDTKLDPLRLFSNETMMVPGVCIGEHDSGMSSSGDATRTTTTTTNAAAVEAITLMQLNKSCCFNYCPHLVATIQLILICLCKLPFCYDYILYFNGYKDLGVMMCIIVEILHTIVLLFIWLLLTLKTEWRMHLRASFSICHWTYHLKHHQQQQMKIEEQQQQQLRRRGAKVATTPGSNNNTTMIQKTDKLLIKGEESSREMQMISMKMTSAAAAAQTAPVKNASVRCSLARADEFNDLSVSDTRGDDDDDDHNNDNDNVDGADGRIMDPGMTSSGFMINESAIMPDSHHHHHHPHLHHPHHHHSHQHRHQLHQSQTLAYSSPAVAQVDSIGVVPPSSFRNKTPSQDDLLNSETMYRNQIRKSIRNVLQYKRPSASGAGSGGGGGPVSIPIETMNDSTRSFSKSNNRFYVHPQQFKIIHPSSSHQQHQHQHQHQHQQQQPLYQQPSSYQTTAAATGASSTLGRQNQPVARLLGTGVYLTTSPSFAVDQQQQQQQQNASSSTPKPPMPHIVTQTSSGTIPHILTSSVFEMPPHMSHGECSIGSGGGEAVTKPILYLNRPSSKEYESRV